MPRYPNDIEYSGIYQDDFYEYRHVILPEYISQNLTIGIKTKFYKQENY